MSSLDPIPFRLLLDRVIEPARRHFRQLFLPVAAPLAVAGMLVSVAQVQWTRALFSGGDDLAGFASAVVAAFAFVVVFLAIYLVGYNALLTGAMDATAGRPVDVRRAWLFVLRPAVLGTVIVVALAGFLSFMLCIVPAFFVVPLLTFVVPVMIEEERYGLDALRRSIELARWNPTGRLGDSSFLKTFVLLLVGLVINYGLSFTAQFPFAIAQQIIFFREAAGGTPSTNPADLLAGTLWLQIPAQVVNALAVATAWFYLTFGVSLLYREIRRRKEARELCQAVEELTAEGAQG